MDVLILVLRKISSYLMAIPLFIGILPGVMFAFYMILPENPPELLVVFVCCYTSGAFAILFITVSPHCMLENDKNPYLSHSDVFLPGCVEIHSLCHESCRTLECS